MKKFLPVLGIILGALVVIGMLFVGPYNGLVNDREAVRNQLNKLSSEYQRRADLVPQLVATVKGAANFEQETLTKVVEARAKATSVKIDVSNATPEQLQRFQSAQGELSSALSRLIAVSESYPQLKATEAFRDLMTQLEGTENRIKVARGDYGDKVQTYNAKLQRFPTNITAGLFRFESFPYFSADPGAETAPKVDFNTQNQQAPAASANN